MKIVDICYLIYYLMFSVSDNVFSFMDTYETRSVDTKISLSDIDQEITEVTSEIDKVGTAPGYAMNGGGYLWQY